MNFTYQGSQKAKILSDLKGSASSTGTPLDLKGSTQEVDEYDLTVSGRGNPKGTTTKKYFLESTRENTMGMLPKPKFGAMGGNPFQEIKREDFEYVVIDAPFGKAGKKPKNILKNLFSKLTANNYLIGLWVVAGYFAYKKFKK